MSVTWKIGLVADTSGLTVRTLHYWDEIGLLKPSRRGRGGHRAYTEDDLARLYVVLTLRNLGLSLDSIRDCVDERVDVPRLLSDQLERLDIAVRDLQHLRARVERIIESGADGRSLSDPADMLRLMRDGRPDAPGNLDEYLNGEQRQALSAAAVSAGPAVPYLLEVEWPQLYRRSDDLRRLGADPGDARMQTIVARLEELSATFGGKQAGVDIGTRTAWRHDPAAMSGEAEQTVESWKELADFVEQARALHQIGAGELQ